MPSSPSQAPPPAPSPGLGASIGGFGVVLLLGWGAFMMGAEVSERELGSLSWLGHLYNAMGLFVVGGLDLGVPSGGPVAARTMLWACYFAAPIVTVAAVVQAFLRAFADKARVHLPLRDHIVLLGEGRIGRLYLEVIQRLEPDRQVVWVGPHDRRAPRQASAARYVSGDLRHPSVQEQCRLDNAVAVVILTDDDHVNLEAATAVVAAHERLANRLVVHLHDIRLKRLVQRAGSAPGGAPLSTTLFGRLGEASTQAAQGSVLATAQGQIFNSHRIAARHLVLRELLPHFAQTQHKDTVVLAGFESFGQTVLEILQREAAGRFHTVVVVDPCAALRLRQFLDQVPLPKTAFALHAVTGDLEDPAVWDEVQAKVTDEADLREGTFVVTTEDDHRNIRLALWLDQHHPEAHLVVRCFRESELTQRLARLNGFQICGDARLITRSLEERHAHWFSPA